jgi:UDP-N-acetylmuramoyl-L-alanyl-D-glutamate--2,6-diaminopimelate ligase
MSTPLLTELLARAGLPAQGALMQPVMGITSDSRQVSPGAVFVALKGDKADGHAFIAQAVAAGAQAVVLEGQAEVPLPAVPVRVANARLELAQLAAAFYPRQPSHMVAVTGTDGKTSTADFYRQLWHGLGARSASLGTLGVLLGDGTVVQDGTHTTPDPVALHRTLSGLAADYACMEASSHGLHQHRLDGVRLEAAAFTYLGRDHLDYHGTPEAYFAAKARLFTEVLPQGATAVLNQDDAQFDALQSLCRARGQRVLAYGRRGADFTVRDIHLLPHGQVAALTLLGKAYELDIPLVGAFQTMNILAALGLAVAGGCDMAQALGCIDRLRGVPGRLEHVATLGCGATVYIDYAHTPLALANILSTLRPHTQNALHVVFGCGGDRDAGKRPEMGRIAAQLADRAIITDDNPRTEDAASIRRAIAVAAPGAKEVADRREAIYVALTELRAGDVLVVAGKGHEKTQIIGTQAHPFDDAEVIRRGVRELGLA